MTAPRGFSILAMIAVLVGVVLSLSGCSDTSRATPTATIGANGVPRSFLMGISSLPPELTEQSYNDTFDLAAQAGEVILIQRTPPWKELIGGALSQETVMTAQREVALAKERGLDIFVAIDPTDSSHQRDRLAGLPEDLLGAGFSDPQIHQALIDYAKFVAETYHPKYLAFGVEINGYQQHQPEDFERFVVIYHEAYEAVKAISKDTLMFPTFQFEELQGRLPFQDPRPAQWYLISRFEPRLDLVAVSSYPDILYPHAEDVPESYYQQLLLYTNRPIAIAGVGFSSNARADQTEAEAEAAQAEFLTRTLTTADQLSMEFVIWFVGQDLSFTGQSTLDLSKSGLLRQDGTAKPAWDVWQEAAGRSIALSARETSTPAATSVPTVTATAAPQG